VTAHRGDADEMNRQHARPAELVGQARVHLEDGRRRALGPLHERHVDREK
jgi:hypothetical protein